MIKTGVETLSMTTKVNYFMSVIGYYRVTNEACQPNKSTQNWTIFNIYFKIL